MPASAACLTTILPLSLLEFTSHNLPPILSCLCRHMPSLSFLSSSEATEGFQRLCSSATNATAAVSTRDSAYTRVGASVIAVCQRQLGGHLFLLPLQRLRLTRPSHAFFSSFMPYA